jgi:hypothetical protein
MNRRGFLRSLIGAAAGVAMDGGSKVLAALTTPKVSSSIFFGFTSAQILESGLIYAPYIPLYVTPVFLNPDGIYRGKSIFWSLQKNLVRTANYDKVNAHV